MREKKKKKTSPINTNINTQQLNVHTEVQAAELREESMKQKLSTKVILTSSSPASLTLMWTPSLSVARMQSPIVRHKLAHSGGLVPVIADTTNEGEVMHVWDVVDETVGACVRFVTRRFWLSQTTWG